MAEERSISEKLRKGEKVICPICKKGILVPYNTTYQTAHSFNCSNDKCNGHVNLDAQIDIE